MLGLTHTFQVVLNLMLSCHHFYILWMKRKHCWASRSCILMQGIGFHANSIAVVHCFQDQMCGRSHQRWEGSVCSFIFDWWSGLPWSHQLKSCFAWKNLLLKDPCIVCAWLRIDHSVVGFHVAIKYICCSLSQLFVGLAIAFVQTEEKNMDLLITATAQEKKSWSSGD